MTTLTAVEAPADASVFASPFALAAEETENDNGHPVVRWALTHRATGMVVAVDTLADALLYMTDPDAEGYLRHSAWDTALHPFALDDDKAAMRRALVAFGDLLGPAVAPDHLCTCGGYLGRDDRRILRHVDVCADEVHPTPGMVGCPDPSTHRVCQTPTPVRCAHGQCTRDNDINAVACLHGHDACCGCCHGEY